MLRIAVIGTYQGAKRFIEYKFREQIEKQMLAKGTYVLKNGDELIILHGDAAQAKSYDFDAFIVTPSYESLEGVVRYRCARETPHG